LNVPELIEELCKVQDLAFSAGALVVAGVLGTEVPSEGLLSLQADAISSREPVTKDKKDVLFIKRKNVEDVK
jgi:hypothetical protein